MYDFGMSPFDLALSLHRQGRLAEAERHYEDILKSDPRHFGALHHLGVAQAQGGKLDNAIRLMRQALELNPRSAEAHNDLGVALEAAGRFEEAVFAYEQALALSPASAETRFNLGNALQALGRHQEAAARFEQTLSLRPDHAEAHNNLGNSLHALGRIEEAIACFERVLAFSPGYAEAHCNLGVSLKAAGRREEAVSRYTEALRIDPRRAETHNNLGDILRDLGRHEEAAGHCRSAIALRPGYAEAHNNLGNALQALDRHEDAIVSYKSAVKLRPDFADAYSNIGNSLQALHRPAEAVASFEKALSLDPDSANAHYNLGRVLNTLERFEPAIVHYEKALAIKPDHVAALFNCGNALRYLNRIDEALARFKSAQSIEPDYAEAHWNESLARLLIGDFDSGFEKYEWRWKMKESETSIRRFPQPLWLGDTDVEGATILLHAEQGLGDTIQFCRYAEMVASLGAKVILEVQPRLKSLAATLRGVQQVLARGETLPGFDLHCPILSLPLALGTRLETIPGNVPYLQALPEHVEKWQRRLGAKTKPRVGLAWSGSRHLRGTYRAIGLERFTPILAPDVEFVSLTKDIWPSDGTALAAHPEIRRFESELEDFSDTAALISLLDLVIAVDTSVAHLAGALGKPIWMPLVFWSDWRWLLDREDSPWYPSLRIFRQSRLGDWDRVVERIALELRGWADRCRSPGLVGQDRAERGAR